MTKRLKENRNKKKWNNAAVGCEEPAEGNFVSGGHFPADSGSKRPGLCEGRLRCRFQRLAESAMMDLMAGYCCRLTSRKQRKLIDLILPWLLACLTLARPFNYVYLAER